MWDELMTGDTLQMEVVDRYRGHGAGCSVRRLVLLYKPVQEEARKGLKPTTVSTEETKPELFLMSSAGDGTVKIWSTREDVDERCLHTIVGHRLAVRCCGVLHEGARKGHIYTAGDDHIARLWLQWQRGDKSKCW